MLEPSPERHSVGSDIVPTGTLRIAVNTSNIVLVQPGVDGALEGVVPVLGRELGRRVGVPVELIAYKRPGEVFAAAASNAWDVCFLAIEPARATEITFTFPYVLIEGAYLVSDNSALTGPEDVDAPGVRIGVGTGSAYDLFLTRTITHATLVRGASATETAIHVKTGELDALAGVRQSLERIASRVEGVHVLPGRFMTIPQAAGVPRSRPASVAAYLDAFVADCLRSGLVARALAASGQDPALAAPSDVQD